MTCHKFLLSRHPFPKKLPWTFTSRSRFYDQSSFDYVRSLSSIPKFKSVNEIKQGPTKDKNKIPKPNLRILLKEEQEFSNVNKKNDINSDHFGTLKGNDSSTVMSTKLKRTDKNYVPQERSIHNLHKCYLDLSKARLTSLVVATAGAGYVMSPAPLVMTPMLYCLAGTALSSAAANTINQIIEVPYDSQMTRTKNRVLVQGLLNPLHAASFASACSALGLSALYFGVNPLVCGLGAANIVLYAFIYTPLKRVSIVNTWVGSIVGAIPPLMGWAACSGSLDLNAFVLAAVLMAWQFPHFNALSWNYKGDYSRAGYNMTCICNEGLCRRSALRYSLLLFPICTASCYMDLTSWCFLAETIPINSYLVYLSYNFYRKGDSKSARSLFMFSLIHLPLVMVLMMLNKKYVIKKNAAL